MEKVVVTGADGFIGRFLVKHLLEKNIEVYAIGLDKSKLDDIACEKLHFIHALFEDYSSLDKQLPKDLDCFFHFAWNGVFGKSFENYNLQLSNAKYACDALMLAIKINCKKFVLASTINTLETRHYMSLDEFQPRYTNIYAMSKLAAEMMCKTIAYQHKIDFNCGIIAMVYGEYNQSKMIPNIVIGNLLQNKETNLVPASTPYDLIYVGDVANAFIAIGEKGKNQKTYYVGHSNLSTFGELFSTIQKIINPNVPLNFGVYPDTNAINYQLIDLDALEKDTNFKPSCNFEESILKTAKWLKETMEE
ncbi:MAG: NAD(P)-dependent oxidoreductase [Erysipelotrichales bacterium]|nr:NAD(P)-dependent oxidoreductase [Erysipelotrichales bacterium]